MKNFSKKKLKLLKKKKIIYKDGESIHPMICESLKENYIVSTIIKDKNEIRKLMKISLKKMRDIIFNQRI